MKRPGQTIAHALKWQGIGVATINSQDEEPLSGVRLRFDRVALRFVHDMRFALEGVVPYDRTLVFTVTAPIRLASKTAAAIEEKVRGGLMRRPAQLELSETTDGNQIRVRLVKGASNRATVIGFVHNPDSDPEILFDAVQSLLRHQLGAPGA